MNRSDVRKIFEITAAAGFLFATPIGYAYYREPILKKWNETYAR